MTDEACPTTDAQVAVVVVNWNGLEDTRRCVASLLASDYADLHVYVVDNGSTRNEASELRASFPSIDVVRLADNYGYAAAANAGVDTARRDARDFVLLLNNDTVIATDTVSVLVRASRELGVRAVIAPLIVRPDGTIWSAGGSLKWPWAAGAHIGINGVPDEYRTTRCVDWASGCALFASIACFDEIGGFDERYFLYLEDMDWCLRARARGFSIWCVPAARVTHEVTKTVNNIDPRIARYYAYRNFYLVGLRHAPMHWRVWLTGHLAVSLAKVLARNAVSSRYRHDGLYNARTRGMFDYIRGRTGKAPYEHRIRHMPQATTSESGV